MISAIGTYLPTVQEFITHWTQANAELGASPVLLQGGFTLANLQADRAALEAAILALQPVDNTRSSTASDRDIKKSAIRARLVQFRAIAIGQLAGSLYIRALPKMPRFSVNEATYLAAFDDMANLWGQINTAPPAGFTAPLVLQGGYTQADFAAEVAALRATFLAANAAIVNARIARERRDLLLPNLRARLRQYRSVAKGRIPVTSPLLNTVPALSPPPGSTPAPVAVGGSWNAAQGKGVLTWIASTNTTLASYSVRTAPAPTYKTTDETAIASVAPSVTTFATSDGLTAPGAVALFRVYVVLTTGNERGSTTVKITRPE